MDELGIACLTMTVSLALNVVTLIFWRLERRNYNDCELRASYWHQQAKDWERLADGNEDQNIDARGRIREIRRILDRKEFHP